MQFKKTSDIFKGDFCKMFVDKKNFEYHISVMEDLCNLGLAIYIGEFENSGFVSKKILLNQKRTGCST